LSLGRCGIPKDSLRNGTGHEDHHSEQQAACPGIPSRRTGLRCYPSGFCFISSNPYLR
jgi:hypothetical protein